MVRPPLLIVYVLLPLLLISSTCCATVGIKEADVRNTLKNLISISWDKGPNSIHSNRGLSSRTSPPACGEILDTWSLAKVKTVLQTFFSQSLSGTEAVVLANFILPKVKYGVQVRKVCASVCSDVVSSKTSNNESISCEKDYGANVQHSGLVMFPLTEQGSDNATLRILPGSRVANVYHHGTRANGAMTMDWNGLSTTSIEAWINVLMTITMGTVAVAPDYMGYGQSLGHEFKAYLIRKGYSTSVVPLVYRTRGILQRKFKTSNCPSSLSDNVILSGYSEGGYASVAVAEALHELGFNILTVEAGGGPFRLATVQYGSTVQRIDQGIFPSDEYYYLALIGSAFSSTYRDLANYNVSQNLLSDDYRDKIANLVSSDASADTLNSVIPVNDPLSIVNSTLVASVRDAISQGVLDACSLKIIAGVNDKVCDALEAQDLANLLEHVTYPVHVCHSVDDQVVDYRNVPNVSKNPRFLSVYNATGTHQEGASTCITQTLFYFLGSDFGAILEAATDSSCSAASSPSTAPTTPTNSGPSHVSNHTESPVGGRAADPLTNPDSAAVRIVPTVAHILSFLVIMFMTLS